jgi:hypothetical protein
VSGPVLAQLMSDRRRRADHFPADLFADPAWDILLDLALAAARQASLSVTDVCAGAGVPQTTALRYINLLEGRGLIERAADPLDRRRFWLSLTPTALLAMQAYLTGKPARVLTLNDQPLDHTGRDFADRFGVIGSGGRVHGQLNSAGSAQHHGD